jgi:choline transport protein
VTPDNMNYCIVAFGVILLISGATWFIDGRKHYKGPGMDIDGMLNGKVEGMDPSAGDSSDKPEVQAKERTL